MNQKHASLLFLMLVAIGISFVLSNQDAENDRSAKEDVRATPKTSNASKNLAVIATRPGTFSEPTRESVGQSRLTVADESSIEDETTTSRAAAVIVQVVSEGGVPLEGCVVSAAFKYIDPKTGHAIGSDLHWSGNTSSIGLVRLPVQTWPPEASCQIQVNARSKTNQIASSSIALAHGEERRIRLELLPTINCSGRVFSSSNRMPLAGISVIARSHGAQCKTITDDSGAFSVPLVSRPRSGTISFEAESISNEVVDTTLEANGSWTASIWEQEGRKLQTLDSLPIYLRVPLSPARAVTGIIRSWEGKPVPGASINLTGYYTKLPGVFTTDAGSAISGRAGDFEIRGLRGDINHSMDVRAEGYGGFQMVVPPAHRAQGKPVDLGEITLEAAFEIQGRVTDFFGAPAEGLVVLAKLLGQRKPHQSSSTKPQSKQRLAPVVTWPDFSARVNSNGHYLLPGRQSGRYSITILNERHRRLWAHFDGGVVEALEFEIDIISNKNIIDVSLGRKEQTINGKVDLPEK